jgi:type IV pilus assembly protein PilE
MQRFYTANDQYKDSRSGTSTSADTMPAQLKRSPADGAQYVRADCRRHGQHLYADHEPVTGSPMATDPCGSFTLTSTGVRGVTGPYVTKTRDECWK